MKKIYIIFAILFAILIGYYAFNKWLDYEDSPLTQANRSHVFNKNTQYIIVKTDSSGATVEKNPPIVYAIIHPFEARSAAGLSWRKIGQSKVDLEKYINKLVYIEGEYYEGIPMYIIKPKQDSYGAMNTEPVIRVNNLTLIE